MPKLISARGRAKASIGIPAQQRLTQAEINELTKCAADPIYFLSTHVTMQHPVFGRCVAPLDPHHVDYINTLKSSHSVISMMPRQSGSTTRTLAFLLWEALFTPKQRIVIQGVNVSMTKYMCDTISFMIAGLPSYMLATVKTNQRTRVEFENGSTLIIGVASGTALRGLSFTRLYLDNFALIPPMVQKDIWLSAVPVLANNGGKAILTSSPRGKNNMFYNIWMDSQRPSSVFTQFKRTVDDLPYATTWKQMIKQQVGEQTWQTDYMCEFL